LDLALLQKETNSASQRSNNNEMEQQLYQQTDNKIRVQKKKKQKKTKQKKTPKTKSLN
jgi:hypothetical protein